MLTTLLRLQHSQLLLQASVLVGTLLQTDLQFMDPAQEHLALLLRLLFWCHFYLAHDALGAWEGRQEAVSIGQSQNSLVVEGRLDPLDWVQVVFLDGRRRFQWNVLALQLVVHLRKEGMVFDLLQGESTAGLLPEQPIAQVSGQRREVLRED